LSEFVIFANPCLEEAEENVKRFMCKLNEMSTKKLSIKELLQSGDCNFINKVLFRLITNIQMSSKKR